MVGAGADLAAPGCKDAWELETPVRLLEGTLCAEASNVDVVESRAVAAWFEGTADDGAVPASVVAPEI